MCDCVRSAQRYAKRLSIASFVASEWRKQSRHPKKTINGCGAFSDECKCRMFGCSVTSKPYTCFCTHDISQHEMISVTDGVVTRFLSDAKILLPPATPVATKDTIELQRRGIYLPNAHSEPSTLNRSGGSKRPIARAADRPPRYSIGRAPVDSYLVFTNRYKWMHFEMIISQIKDIIIESGSHAVMGRVLTLVLSRLIVGRRVVSPRGVVFTLTAVPTALVLVRIGVLISPLLTSTTPWSPWLP